MPADADADADADRTDRIPALLQDDTVKNQFNQAKFALALKAKRGDQKLRYAELKSGISIATLSRIERGYTPDLDTLLTLCDWLEIPAASFLIFDGEESSGQEPTTADRVSVLLRGERELSGDVANALSVLVAHLCKNSVC